MANLFRDFPSVLALTKHLQTVDTRNKDFVILRILRIPRQCGGQVFLYLTKKSLLAYEIYHFGTMNIRCSKHTDIDIRGLSGKYPAILNISGTGRVDFM
jgi:hypothetical protein